MTTWEIGRGHLASTSCANGWQPAIQYTHMTSLSIKEVKVPYTIRIIRYIRSSWRLREGILWISEISGSYITPYCCGSLFEWRVMTVLWVCFLFPNGKTLVFKFTEQSYHNLRYYYIYKVGRTLFILCWLTMNRGCKPMTYTEWNPGREGATGKSIKSCYTIDAA